MALIFFKNPFFWALVSMFTLVGACSVVGGRKIGSHPTLGWIIVTIFFLGRFILVLPFIDQPRFYLSGLNFVIGIPIFVIGLFFALAPCFLIRLLNIAEKNMNFINPKGRIPRAYQWVFTPDNDRRRKSRACAWNKIYRI